MSAATIASLIFFICSLITAATIESLSGIAEAANVSVWAFEITPSLLAALYALILYENAERKVRRLGQSISRGILVMLLTWVSFAALITYARWRPHEFSRYLGSTLTASGMVGGGPMLLCAMGAGLFSGVLIIRRPRPPIQ
jgi:hypothetical protein